MDIDIVPINKPEEINFVLGQAHFIKTVEDVHEALMQSVPGIQFGFAFCEASGPCLIRLTGTDEAMIKLAKENALRIGAGHTFILFLKNCFPINVMPAIRNLNEVCRIYCATANQTEVMVGKTDLGRGIMGVIDGQAPKGVENEEDIKKRKAFLRNIGYKVA